MPKNENIDAFWDIEDLIPQRPKKTLRPHVFSDTEAAEVRLDAPSEQSGEKVPPKAAEIRKKEAPSVIREYDCEGMISHVRVLPWPTVFEFYTKFRRDALRYFSLTHPPCEYVYFFSYMSQYEQMTVSQMSYYLYWREEARRGNYLKTDINYLFLYIYEIINLPEKIPPAKGAGILSRLWRVYREEFRYLDKYLGEWLCDYCLIHGVSPDWEELASFTGEIASKVSLPEFYLKNGEMSWSMIESVSSYDYKKSKYYDAYAKEYDLHIPAALERAVNTVVMKNLGDFGIVSMTTVRDSYAGAIAAHGSKFKLEITRYALRKTSAKGEYDLKHIFSNLIKLAENQLRSIFGIKSRFSPVIPDARLKQAILSYFNEQFPERNGRSRKKEAQEEAYMMLYEPKQTGPADISRALDIEKQAWETADLLSVGEEEDEGFFATDPIFAEDLPAVQTPDPSAPATDLPTAGFSDENMQGGEFDFIADVLTQQQRQALQAALDGNFAAHCRSVGVMEENMRGTLNEIAMEYIGDMILEADFSVIEDYGEDVCAMLRVSAKGNGQE